MTQAIPSVASPVASAVRQALAIKLRPYQQNAVDDVRSAWASGLNNVLLVIPTGGGKTVVFGSLIAEEPGAAVAVAHRKELVAQVSMALARYGVRHKVIGQKDVIRLIVRQQMAELGTSYVDQGAKTAVASVDTLTSSKWQQQLSEWAKTVTLWVQDEAHHVLAGNKWGRAVEMFPNARGLGVTATPKRADRKGLGRNSDGVFDHMVEGPSVRWLIENGYLCDYVIYAPQSDFNRDSVKVSDNTGDFTQKSLNVAVKNSHIMGDIVTHYKRAAEGLKGITFLPDVETATEQAHKFNAAGVKCEVVSAKTPAPIRNELLRRFREGDIDELVNVDLFGEGFDLPALHVVSMGRATESLGLYLQQFGRALRPIYAEGFDLSTARGRLDAIAAGPKPKAIILDHVGNVERHRLPDSPRDWGLDGEKKRKRTKPDDSVPVRSCPACTAVFERVSKTCPHCGHYPEPASRSAPEFVDGDLTELDAETLAKMRGDVSRIDGPARIPQHLDARAAGKVKKNHAERQGAQQALRASIAWWAGYQRSMGREDSEIYRRFYFTFGIDTFTAQTLGRPDALELADKVNTYIGEEYAKWTRTN